MDYNIIIQCNKGGQFWFENIIYFFLVENMKNFCKFNVISLKFMCWICVVGYYSI